MQPIAASRKRCRCTADEAIKTDLIRRCWCNAAFCLSWLAVQESPHFEESKSTQNPERRLLTHYRREGGCEFDLALPEPHEGQLRAFTDFPGHVRRRRGVGEEAVIEVWTQGQLDDSLNTWLRVGGDRQLKVLISSATPRHGGWWHSSVTRAGTSGEPPLSPLTWSPRRHT